MALTANVAGVVRGKFTIPAGIPAGSKRVAFQGAGESRGEAIFSGQGTIEHNTFLRETEIVTQRWVSPPPPPRVAPAPIDPLAQTFSLDANTQIAGVDLWFSAKPVSATKVQLRQTTAGFPDQRILGEVDVDRSTIAVDGTPTRVLFENPPLALGGVEYAIVVLCNDAVGALSVAEIGKFDAGAQKWITSQPYNVGVLLSSSNASTWTAHQDRDLAFRILKATITQVERTIDLGNVAVAGASDLMLMSYAERPSGITDVQYRLTMPDTTSFVVADGQPIQLPATITGDIKVEAVLRGGDLSPVLHPGAQLVAGAMATTADYVTRAIPAGTSATVRVLFQARIPSGATVTVQYKGPDAGDTWITIPRTAQAQVGDGFVEFTHSIASVNEQTVQIKMTLSGNAAARPRVRDLRAFVL